MAGYGVDNVTGLRARDAGAAASATSPRIQPARPNLTMRERANRPTVTPNLLNCVARQIDDRGGVCRLLSDEFNQTSMKRPQPFDDSGRIVHTVLVTSQTRTPVRAANTTLPDTRDTTNVAPGQIDSTRRAPVAQPIAHLAMTARQKVIEATLMMSRSTQSSVTGRASAMRRMRRRATAASHLYCSTNGCASYLELDPVTRKARCPICGYVRRIN